MHIGGRDGRTLVWALDVDQGRLELAATLPCGSSAVSSICLSAEGNTIWTGGLDNKIRRWDKALVEEEGGGGDTH